jgi:hypothetical protein
MGNARGHSLSPRILRLAEKLRSSKYRHSYVGAHVRQFLARQMRGMRGDQSQAIFGEKIEKAQNVVSRFEDPSYGKWTLSSLLEIATKLDRALIVRFVDYQTFLQFTDDQSEIAAAPAAYDSETVENAAWMMAQQQSLAAIDYNVRIDAVTDRSWKGFGKATAITSDYDKLNDLTVAPSSFH